MSIVSPRSSDLRKRLLPSYLLALGALASACTDNAIVGPTPPQSDLRRSESSASDDKGDIRGVARFSIELRATGPFAPRAPITLEYSVTANLPTPNAEITLQLPDVQLARANRWRAAPVHAALRARLAPEFEFSKPMTQGEILTQRRTITIQEPGYYRVIATANAPNSKLFVPDVGLVQSFAYREIWILVDKSGGRVTSDYDASVFPDNVRELPGVRRIRTSHFTRPTAPVPAVASKTAASYKANVVTASYDPYANQGRLVFQNPETQQILPLNGVRFLVEIENVQEGAIVYSYNDWTDGDGRWAVGCPGGNQYVHVTFFYDGIVRMMDAPAAGAGYADGACGIDEGDWFLGAVRGHLWTIFNQVADASLSLLGRTRNPVDLLVQSTGGSEYSWGPWQNDRITMDESINVFSAFGIFTAAHEWGHAVHHRAIGAYPSENTCPDPHGFQMVVHRSCAYKEGFANYHAVATMGSQTGGLAGDIEANIFYSYAQGDGTQNEGTVAAFLLDITDPPNEPHDVVQYPGTYLVEIINTCEVRIAGNFWRPQSINGFIYCMEQAADPANFPYLGTVEGQREGAIEPPGWSQNAIRSLWRRNLFNQ